MNKKTNFVFAKIRNYYEKKYSNHQRTQSEPAGR